MEQAPRSVEVDLVAAPPSENVEQDLPEEQVEEPEPALLPEPEDVIIPEIKPPDFPPISTQPRPAAQSKPSAKPRPISNSELSGQDEITQQSSQGAQGTARPDYFRNPAPAYPEASRRAGHEGRVLLVVQVSAQGRVDTISVQSSSGHTALDNAAVNTVKKWVFKPAIAAGVPIRSNVKIPIRFELD